MLFRSHYALAPQGDAVAIESRDAQGQMVSHTTPLLVLAEGSGPQRAATPRRDALLRREGTRRRTFDAALTAGREYGQSAVVCEVRTELPHGHRAWERFTPEGPLALLPTGDALALVWSTNHETAHALCALREPAFLARLATHFGGRLGRFLSASARSAFPVSLAYRRELAMPRVLAIGNAAQTLHPVAGQGLNLGFRDAHALAEALQAPGSREDPGAAPVLQRFLDARLLDRRGGIAFTDALVRIFSNDIGALGVMRGAGLTALDCLPPLRHFVARRMMFGANGF